MTALNIIRSDLSHLRDRGPGLVAVFVGATNGIGEATVRAFAQHADKPHIYLVGRSQAQADLIKQELQASNEDAQIRFLQSDVSLLRNVDKVCDEIVAAEDKVNLLFLSAGMLTMAGRTETTEGLDQKLSLHYYSRMRFVHRLLPLLDRASRQSPSPSPSTPSSPSTSHAPLARVISVLGGGLENSLNTSDLSLKHNFSLSNCANHAITMTSLLFTHHAKTYPRTTFIQTQPGGVRTNITRNLSPVVGLPLKLLAAMPLPFMMSARESGERHAWAATTARFDRAGLKLLGPKGVEASDSKAFAEAKRDGTMETVVKHTEDMFEDVCGTKTA